MAGPFNRLPSSMRALNFDLWLTFKRVMRHCSFTSQLVDSMQLAPNRLLAWSLAAAALVSAGSVHAADCYNLSKGEPKTLNRELQYVLFAGPPNFEDVQKGDTPEPTYVLKLDHAICIKGDEFADPGNMFEQVRLVGSKETWPLLRASVKQRVRVTLKDQIAAETGHHHEPLVAISKLFSTDHSSSVFENGIAVSVDRYCIRSQFIALSSRHRPEGLRP